MSRKTTTTIIGMLVLGGLISVAYASTTIITDTGITTTNLTILGTCTGCGGTEGTFTTYTTLFNGTIAGSAGCTGSSIYVNNTGTVIFEDACPNTFVVQPSGTTSNIPTALIATPTSSYISQSVNGLYQIGLDTNTVQVFKNNAIVQKIGLKLSNFHGSHISGGDPVSIAISPNGKYIAIQGEDVGALLDRVVIFKGA